jgi:hypothetical protein
MAKAGRIYCVIFIILILRNIIANSWQKSKQFLVIS